jgi:hypothetical protein
VSAGEQGCSYLDCAKRLVELGAEPPSLVLVLVDLINNPISSMEQSTLARMDGLLFDLIAQYRYGCDELEKAREVALGIQHDGAQSWKAAMERSWLESWVGRATHDSGRAMRL